MASGSAVRRSAVTGSHRAETMTRATIRRRYSTKTEIRSLFKQEQYSVKMVMTGRPFKKTKADHPTGTKRTRVELYGDFDDGMPIALAHQLPKEMHEEVEEMKGDDRLLQ
ncbi:hypothetical protein AAHA92_15109 [Salvia divinorum]|uniref:Uncharacterized protein n=1 Tax=Salvia divinorum TaxID=28513 RepID=A0ABD1HEF5_SALDI